jgi:hypothetical protein
MDSAGKASLHKAFLYLDAKAAVEHAKAKAQQNQKR